MSDLSGELEIPRTLLVHFLTSTVIYLFAFVNHFSFLFFELFTVNVLVVSFSEFLGFVNIVFPFDKKYEIVCL